MKNPKRGRRREEMTVFVLCCDGKYALRKRPDTGLLAGLWEFPHISGKLTTDDAIAEVERMGVSVKNIERQVERKHIFTHVEWDMRGVYLETADTNEAFCWLTPQQINREAALPTAFRQFWEEIDHV